MAIYHLSGQIISRISPTGSMRSAVAAAAYRSGERLHNDADNTNKFYYREIKPECFILAPDGAPDWVLNRERLWNEVEKTEKQYNAQLAREFNIALPVELNPEEQNNLTREFCQEAFASDGMVADVSIHRDHKDNPHFHVMLTLRRINADGTFQPKCHKEYVLDEQENKIKLPSGNYKSIRVNNNDWNSVEKLAFWRTLWQDKTNAFLEKNGFSERVNCRSFHAQNLEFLPSIHEGYKVRKLAKEGANLDIININNDVKKHNETVVKINEYKEQKIARCFTPQEKKDLAESAHVLKIFVNNNTIIERKAQLKRWEKSIFFNGNFEKLERLEKDKLSLEKAESILTNEANRFVVKYYPELSQLSDHEKMCLVQRSVDANSILSYESALKEIQDYREKQFNDSIKFILKNPSVYSDTLVRAINSTERNIFIQEQLPNSKSIDLVKSSDAIKIDNASGQYHIYQNNHSMECFIGIKTENGIEKCSNYMSLEDSRMTLKDVLHGNFQNLILQNSNTLQINKLEKRLDKLDAALVALDKLYDAKIRMIHPDVNPDMLSIKEKESVLGINTDNIPSNRRYGAQNNVDYAAFYFSLLSKRDDILHDYSIDAAKDRALRRQLKRNKQRTKQLHNGNIEIDNG